MKQAPILLVPCILALTSCVGTPHLLREAAAGSDRASPSIDDVKTEIVCELARYKHDEYIAEHPEDADVTRHPEHKAARRTAHFQSAYLVTATLTLQVDDYLDVTPSIKIIHPFPLKASSDNRTVLASADIGGQRERTYSETFYLDSSLLPFKEKDRDFDTMMATSCNPERVFQSGKYSLRGDLKLNEIIDNGEKSIAFSALYAGAPSANTNPSFGSTVEFIVTRAMTGLGLQWTFVHFNGPSGTNGLINGKKVATDKLIITLSRQLPVTKSDESKLIDKVSDLIAAIEAHSNARQEEAAKAAANQVAEARQASLEKPYQALNRGRRRPQPPSAALVQARAEAAQTRNALAAARTQSATAAQDLQAAQQAVKTASKEAPAPETVVSGAAIANQQLQQTMILQSLNIQPK